MPRIVFKDVSFSYVDAAETYEALEHVDLEIDDGQFVCLVGHSGCGKSTMLSLLAGLELPTAGQVLIDSAPVTGPGPDRSIVFQNYSLFPWLTAMGNVAFAIRQTGIKVTRAQAEQRAGDLLKQVGVADAAHRYPSQLSGGMRQRVAIARALAIDAPVMLLDEPFGALDPMIRHRLQEMMLNLWADACCKTAVFVTHDIDEALILADRIVFMEPKRIIRILDLPKDRPHDLQALDQDAGLRAIKQEVMELFQATVTGREEE